MAGIKLSSFAEAVRIASFAGKAHANKRARAAGREEWNEEDWDAAAEITRQILVDFGYDTTKGGTDDDA